MQDIDDLRHWYTRAALFWTGFCCAGLSVVKPLIVGSLIDAYHYSPREAGLIAGFEMIGIGAGALLVSSLGARWTRHTVIRLGAVLGIIGSLAPFVSAHFLALFLLRGLAGVGSGFIAAAVLSTIGRTPDPDRTFGLYFIFSYLLAAAFFPIVSATILHFGADGSYYALALILLSVFVSVRMIPDSPIARPTIRGDLPPFPFKQAGMSLAVSVFFWIGNGAVWSFTERLGIRAGVTPLQIGTILAFGQLASIAGAGTAAFVNTRFGRLGPTFAAIALSIFSLAMIGTGSTPAYVAGALVFSFAWTLFLTYLNGLMSAQDSAGRVVALSVTSQTVGMAIGPSVGGALVASYGYQSIPTFGIAAHLVAVALLVLMVFSRPRPVAQTEVPVGD